MLQRYKLQVAGCRLQVTIIKVTSVQVTSFFFVTIFHVASFLFQKLPVFSRYKFLMLSSFFLQVFFNDTSFFYVASFFHVTSFFRVTSFFSKLHAFLFTPQVLFYVTSFSVPSFSV